MEIKPTGQNFVEIVRAIAQNPQWSTLCLVKTGALVWNTTGEPHVAYLNDEEDTLEINVWTGPGPCHGKGHRYRLAGVTSVEFYLTEEGWSALETLGFVEPWPSERVSA